MILNLNILSLFQFFGIQLGVCQYKPEFSEPTVLNIMAPFHTSVYAKVFIGKRYIHLFLCLFYVDLLFSYKKS